jgi:hypothetical protein
VRLGAFRRVLTAISNLASSAALFLDMLECVLMLKQN